VLIGWGSLIWQPEKLKFKSEWYGDGSWLPLEFARISSDGRLTLFRYQNAHQVQTYWAELEYYTFNEA